MRASNRAFSLVELLVTLFVLSVICGAIYLGIYSSTRSVDQLELTSLLQQETRAMMEIMARDLRLAGSFPNGIDPMSCALTCEGIVSANSSSIQIARDLNGDGCCDDYDEIVTYNYDPSQGEICRKSSNDDQCEAFVGGLEDEDVGVKLNSFEFKYYDVAGNLTSNKEDIVRIQIKAVLVSNKSALSGSVPELPLELNVNIRNRVLGL